MAGNIKAMLLGLPFDMVGLSGLCSERNTREAKIFFCGGPRIFVCMGFANKRESRMYDSVYYLRSRNTTKNTLNIKFLGECV